MHQKHIATLTLRRVAKCSVLSVVPERAIARSKVRLIRNSDILTRFQAARSLSGTPVNGKEDPGSSKLYSNEYDHGAAFLSPATNAAQYTTPTFPC